jgi:Zn-dependent membrane protease YugP
VAATFKRGRILLSLGLIAGTLLFSAGVLLYLLTRPIEIEFAQDPNPQDQAAE